MTTMTVSGSGRYFRELPAWVLAFIAPAATSVVADAQSIAEVLAGRTVPNGLSDFCYDVNRSWTETTPIPGAYPWNSEYVEQADEASLKLRELVWAQNAPPNVRRFLASFMDTERRDEQGLRPLFSALDRIDAIQTQTDIAALIAVYNKSHRELISGIRFPTPTPFFINVWTDPRDSRRQIARLEASGLGLPDRSYYFDPDAEEVRSGYEAHIGRVLSFAGFPDAREMAARALTVETAIARALGELAALQDGGRGARVFSLDGLSMLAPEFDWPTFFANADLQPTDEILVMQPAYVQEVARLIAETSIEDFRAYVRWQLLHRYAMFLSTEFADAEFDFFGQVVQGQSEPGERRLLAQNYVEAYLARELSDEYVQRFVSAREKAAAISIAEDVRMAYRRHIQAADWLSESARSEAVRKLENLLIGMLYPERSEEYRSPGLSDEDLPGNLIRLSEQAYGLQLQRLRRPTQRDDWWDPPISVSGSYSVSLNSLIITAARANSPLFDGMADEPENYGGLGTLIGHEMGHAFDDQGSLYDGDGNLRSWWNDDDRREFERRTASLAEQYSRLEPLPGLHMDGRAVLSESIADLTGLLVGFDALQIALAREGAEFSADDKRRFFQAWARRWRVQYTEPLLVRILKADTHPPLQYRCSLPLANFDAFYEVVGIDADSPLFVSPDDRVSIW